MMIVFICLVILLTGFVDSGDPFDVGITAFTKGQTDHLHLLSGEIVNFNNNISIVNSRFDGNGKFVCSAPGIYSFHFFSLTMNDVNVWLEVFKNDQLVVSLFGNTPHDYADAGNSVILHLTTGDTVYVKAHSSYETHLFGTKDQVYTTFTGVLLHSDIQAEELGIKEAFSVGLTHHMHLMHGEGLVYNDVITDVRTSSGYDLVTGRYNAPAEGIYIFFYHSLAQSSKALWLELYHNGNYVNAAFGRTSGRYADSGNCAILHLKAGDTVYIKGRNEYGVDLFGAPDQIYNTFSGALLSSVSSEIDGEEIAFSAGLSHHFSGSKLVFDKIFLNVGNGYNQLSGVFTAPKTGIYVFYYYALARQNAVIYVDLYHNHEYVNSIYGHTPSDYAAGGNAAVLDLLSGDTVYLSIRDAKSQFFGTADQIYCTFSGHFVGENIHLGPIG